MIFDHTSGSLSQLDLTIVHAVPAGGNWRDLPEVINSARVQQIRESAARNEGSRSTYYGRLRWDRPSYTISTYFNRPGNGCFIHPSANRLITIREAARLQSFPDSYRFYGRGRARFLQVGNAVPPLLAYQLGRLLTPGTLVDLFSGAGGLSLGLEWAGFKALAAVDSDRSAAQTFQENRSEMDLAMCTDLADESDVRRAIDEIKRRTGRAGIDLVAGGPPCQGFSTAGHCRLDDSRNKLLHAFVGAVEELQPVQVLMENVPALTFRSRRTFLDQVLQSIRQMGYQTSFIVAHAEGYGVPQLRRRLFVLGVKGARPHWPQPFRQILPPMLARYQPPATEPSLEYPTTVREAISDLPLDVAPEPHRPTDYTRDAESRYQKWLRGELTLDAFCPQPLPAEEPPLLFDVAETA